MSVEKALEPVVEEPELILKNKYDRRRGDGR